MVRVLCFVVTALMLCLSTSDAIYAKNPPFSAKSKKPVPIAPYSFLRTQCPADFAIQTTEIGTLNHVRFPLESDLDAIVARFSQCRFESIKIMQNQGSYRIFPGLKPYYLDPFTPGEVPPEYAGLKPDYANITIDDAMTEPAMWRLISAYAVFTQVERQFKEQSRLQGNAGITEGPLEKDAFGFYAKKAADPKKIVLTQADIERARPLAMGARIRATRALLWQYQQMKVAPDFSLDHCRRFGPAQVALGYAAQIPPPTKAPVDIDETFSLYNAEFKKKSLPKLLASLGQVTDYTQLVDDQTGRYTLSVFQNVPYYACVLTAEDFVRNIASNKISDLRNQAIEAERLAIEKESLRQQVAAKAAVERNAKAASGNFAPVDDDILRAVIDARRDAISPNVALGQTLLPGESFSFRYNYETGFYWERLMGIQEVALTHKVRNTGCSRKSAQPVVYNCTFDMQLDISASVFGLTSPIIKTPFSRYSETVRFVNGSWSIDGLTERYALDRRKRAGSVSSFDHAKAAKEFHCISSNNFADQYGLVRDIDC